MSDIVPETNSPVAAATLAGIPAALVPASIKALDRLIGAAVDVPVAWLNQQRAKIESKTAALMLVDDAIAGTVAKTASGEPEIINRAMESLLRGAYRKQVNREAVASVFVEEMSRDTDRDNVQPQPKEEIIADDWLNLFERLAEDASSERMQQLWGRVLAGEVSRPGRYSVRTLRIIAEIDPISAEWFQKLSKLAFEESFLYQDPSLIWNEGELFFQLSRLIEVGLLHDSADEVVRTITIEPNGRFIMWGTSYAAAGRLPPSAGTERLKIRVLRLTNAGRELLNLVNDFDEQAALKRVVEAEIVPALSADGGFAYIGRIQKTEHGRTIALDEFLFGSVDDVKAALAEGGSPVFAPQKTALASDIA
ncbi:DUF2806 domain-containing protein [Altererythrobacter xixiisoli]|uniref:DUF2806 domain-containing protein n=1 Tax=Croceibacterium xixiisoli TaxID=1476466 RepID=A0A6I4TUX6_9SPHN|nr:DUF2806 domain-containing protein [Croceibacterium xixiisoli]MXO99000.1 DUF2806 domain-containing protein [Croceibacterium xixiisoli]